MNWLKIKVVKSLIKMYEHNVLSVSSDLGLADLNEMEVTQRKTWLNEYRMKTKILKSVLKDLNK